MNRRRQTKPRTLPPDVQQVSIRMPRDLALDLSRIADRHGRTRHAEILRILQRYADAYRDGDPEPEHSG